MEECPVSEVGASLHTGHCVWGEYWLEPELQRGLHTNHYLVDKPGGETVFLLSLTSQADVRRKLRELENQAWFSPWTSKVEITFLTYNAHIGVITTIHINLFLNRAGHIYKQIEPVSVWIDPYHGWWCYAADASWALLILKIVIEEGKDIIHHWRQLGI